MRIVILGAGELGCTIAEILSNEKNDVVVVDSDETKLEKISRSLDVLTINADGTDPSFTKDPDIKKASVLVAVTEVDETNILACLIAKKNGIPHTIARLRNPKFLHNSSAYVRENFGIDFVLSPEVLTAEEICRILMTPSALNVEDFANGKVRLYEARMHSDSPYLHKPLKDLMLPASILVAMIFRDHRMMIPHGDDYFLPFDRVYFVGTPDAIKEFSRDFAPGSTQKTERALIIGAGRTGQALAPLLEKEGVSLKIIDKDPDRCESLTPKLKKGIVLCGDGTDIELLKEEGISEADVIICTTKDEQLNLLIALLAKHLGAKKSIVRVIRPEYVNLMTRVGVDIVLSVRLIAASEVLSYIRRQDVVSVSLLESAQIQATEIILPADAPVTGIPLMNTGIPKGGLICAYVRGDETFIPSGASVLEAGDRVIIITSTDASADILSYFKGKSES